MDRKEWLTLYKRIWSDNEFSGDLIRRLFTEDAVYRPNVLPTIERSYVGHDEILEYMKRVVPTLQWENSVSGGTIDAGDTFVRQTWLWGIVEGKQCTEVLCTVYKFAVDGRCREVRDFVQTTDSIIKPFSGWAST